MSVNKYAGKCHYCGNHVPANAGILSGRRGNWRVSHLSCDSVQGARVVATTFSSGETVIQNSNGRCEDAPCCGCCS